jgi:hypothetical protein
MPDDRRFVDSRYLNSNILFCIDDYLLTFDEYLSICCSILMTSPSAKIPGSALIVDDLGAFVPPKINITGNSPIISSLDCTEVKIRSSLRHPS